jgi:hypothetical protein
MNAVAARVNEANPLQTIQFFVEPRENLGTLIYIGGCLVYQKTAFYGGIGETLAKPAFDAGDKYLNGPRLMAKFVGQNRGNARVIEPGFYEIEKSHKTHNRERRKEENSDEKAQRRLSWLCHATFIITSNSIFYKVGPCLKSKTLPKRHNFLYYKELRNKPILDRPKSYKEAQKPAQSL